MDRASGGCLCCESRDLQLFPTLVSPYLAFKAWGGEPEPTSLVTCAQCAFRFYSRDFTDSEADEYYREYRTETYYEERHRFEPFYTRAVHNETGHWLASAARRSALSATLAQAGTPKEFSSVLDYGGGTGALVRDLVAERKAVFDVSEVVPEAKLEHLRVASDVGADWELVICAQVLEHVAYPAQLMGAMVAAASPGGFIYLELPNQQWRQPVRPPRGMERWMRFLCRHPRVLLAADVYSTGFRVKTGALPPYGFVPMREHINFFTLEAMVALASRFALKTIHYQKDSQGSLVLVARKH
jgi:hypothetical protein